MIRSVALHTLAKGQLAVVVAGSKDKRALLSLLKVRQMKGVMEMSRKGLIWLVDDSASFLASAAEMLVEAGYEVSSYSSPKHLLNDLFAHKPDVIISDVVMPDIDGVMLLDEVNNIDSELPVVLITSYPKYELAKKAIKNRAFDLLEKPLTKEQLELVTFRATVYRRSVTERRKCHANLEETVLARTAQLQQTLDTLKYANIETIHVLTRAAEFRHNETAEHIVRIGLYAHQMAMAMGLDNQYCDDLRHASPMHDIGKIGIPDQILLKSSQLTKAEFAVMKKHTVIGASMFHDCSTSTLKMAEHIALCHHERWDGSGYPEARKGDRIPLSARIVMLADQYDALRSSRPYKPPLSHKKVVNIMANGDDRTRPEHFDPQLLEVFMRINGILETIFDKLTLAIDSSTRRIPQTYESISETNQRAI